ncbi:MAG: polysaccharide deacetylase family protein [Bryobacteraceae bacterium]
MVGPLAGLAATAGAMAWAVRGRASSVFAPSVWHGSRNRRTIALTFDDGPSESTEELLRILEQYGVPATFFECGMHVRRLPSVARAVFEAGHEIGNHTENHPYLALCSAAFIHNEMARAEEAITSATGFAPTLFRAPFGVRWFGLREAQAEIGLMGVMWTTIGLDWRLRAPEIATRVMAGAGNGAILCLHDGRTSEVRPDIRETVEAVRRIVPALLEKGYRLETVTKLLR